MTGTKPQEAQRKSSRIITKKLTPGRISFKLQKIKDRENILKNQRRSCVLVVQACNPG
jgi:hypothetical protein